MKVKIKQLEAIEIADGALQVRRNIEGSVFRLTVEVRDGKHYLKSNVWKGEELRGLFYFIKPLVTRFLENQEANYSHAIKQNVESLDDAIKNKRSRVWDFLDPTAYHGKRDLLIPEAEKLLEEERMKLSEIRAELEQLKKLGEK